jgi:hypothetical protein
LAGILTFNKLDDGYLYWSRNYGDRVELNGQFCLQMPCDLVEIAEKEFTVFSMNKLNESLEIIRSMIDDYLNQNKMVIYSREFELSNKVKKQLLDYNQLHRKPRKCQLNLRDMDLNKISYKHID